MRYFVQNTLRLTTVMRETVLDGAYAECSHIAPYGDSMMRYARRI